MSLCLSPAQLRITSAGAGGVASGDHRWTTIEMTPPQGMVVGGNWSNASFQRRFVLMPQHEVEAIRQTVDVAFKRLLALGETIESLCDFEP